MKALLLATALAACPLVAYAQAPAAPADDLAAGHALRLAGKPAEAVPLLERATRAHPQDADAWLDLGLAYSATGRFDAAARALDTAQRLAPDYAEVKIARARLAYFQGDAAEAQRRLAPVLQAGSVSAEARELAAGIEAAARDQAHPWRIDASVARADLTNGLPSATDLNLGVARRLRNATVGANLEHIHQFGRSDTYGEISAGGRYGSIALGGAPDADFRPEVALRGELLAPVWPVGGGWAVQLGVAGGWARYAVGEVRGVHPTFALLRGENLRLTGRWIQVTDEQDRRRSGYAVRANWLAAPRVRLSMGWSDSPETSEGVTNKVRAVSGGAAIDVSDLATLRVGLSHEHRRAYDRTELMVGAGRRF